MPTRSSPPTCTAEFARRLRRPVISAALIAAFAAACVTPALAAGPAWQADVYYTAGTVVSFNGRAYRALVNQTDYASTGWNPTVTSLWTDMGADSGAPAPAPPPASPAPAPAPAPTPAPTPSPAPAPASGSCPAWNGATAYTGGAVVSVGSTNYRANWWTQGQSPTTNNGPAGSGQPWTTTSTCAGAPAPGPAPSPAPAPAPAPSPAPAPAPTPAPSPAPAPGPAPAPPSADFAKHALVGYWHNFTNPSGTTFPLSQVSPAWDVIVVAFADSAGAGAVSFTVDPSAGSASQFIADVASLRAKGKKVVLSLGGQNGTVSLSNATEVANFVDSLAGIVQTYGFDGIDLDLENGVSQGAPIQGNLVTAVKQLKARLGNKLYLSMAPEWPYVQGGYTTYGSIWGAYLPIIDGLRNDLSVIHVQYYNNGGLYSSYSDAVLPEGSTDMLVGGSRMLIEGFPLARGAAGSFTGLRPDQVAFGLPSGPSSANSGVASSGTIGNALDCLTRLAACGSIRPTQAYPTFRGVMTWSINWDRHDNFVFSKPVGDKLKSLP